jgi:hypothetical protein
MPIKAEMRWFYPIDWPQLSRHVRFERAGGVCQGCGRPHGAIVRCLPDGRWYYETVRPGAITAAAWPVGPISKKQLVHARPASFWPLPTLIKSEQ